MSKDTVVIITGASTGFGRAAAETLARRGYTVFAGMRDTTGRNASICGDVRSVAKRERLALEVLDMDVTQDSSVQQAVQQVVSHAGKIDVVINNAGVAAVGVTEAYSVAEFQRLFDVNLFGVIRVNRAVLPAMRGRRSGLLIHVSSAAGRVAIPCMAAYCASKFALEALADVYRFELTPFGIDSVIVEPGIHRTPILEKFVDPADGSRTSEYGVPAKFATRVRTRFEEANSAADTPGAEEVVEAFVRIMETTPGQRPFRTVPTASLEPLLAPYNAAAAEIRPAVAHIFNVVELLDLQRTL
jgi:NAD(P)-dependent dehydrogenase (short-subunit alcohol dehydrogenase family)